MGWSGGTGTGGRGQGQGAVIQAFSSFPPHLHHHHTYIHNIQLTHSHSWFENSILTHSSPRHHIHLTTSFPHIPIHAFIPSHILIPSHSPLNPLFLTFPCLEWDRMGGLEDFLSALHLPLPALLPHLLFGVGLLVSSHFQIFGECSGMFCHILLPLQHHHHHCVPGMDVVPLTYTHLQAHHNHSRQYPSPSLPHHLTLTTSHQPPSPPSPSHYHPYIIKHNKHDRQGEGWRHALFLPHCTLYHLPPHHTTFCTLRRRRQLFGLPLLLFAHLATRTAAFFLPSPQILALFVRGGSWRVWMEGSASLLGPFGGNLILFSSPPLSSGWRRQASGIPLFPQSMPSSFQK